MANMNAAIELAKLGYKIRGVVHVGINDGEEIPSYFDIGVGTVVCFEPLPRAGAFLLSRFGGDPRVVFIPCALGDHNGFDFLTTTSAHGRQSTMLTAVNEEVAFGEYAKEYQQVVPIARLDTLMRVGPPEVNCAVRRCNCLVIDAQGMEHHILFGMAKLMGQFDCAGIECSEIPIYDGEAPEATVLDFMKEHGFRALNGAGQHGDVLFVRGVL